ncbi:MAG TPA: hypothetical protein VFY34_07715 [Pyrinomonadaceae bacterium]|nr:hypothetical protein [Pyrinomonadaceae bacterium]
MFAADTDEILQVPLLGNRVDRFFVWNGSTLTFDHNRGSFPMTRPYKG